MNYKIVIDPGHQEKANLEQEPIGPGATIKKAKVTRGAVGVATGQTEADLNEVGINEAEKLKELVNSLDIDVVISSPLRRAKDTAKILYVIYFALTVLEFFFLVIGDMPLLILSRLKKQRNL